MHPLQVWVYEPIRTSCLSSQKGGLGLTSHHQRTASLITTAAATKSTVTVTSKLALKLPKRGGVQREWVVVESFQAKMWALMVLEIFWIDCGIREWASLWTKWFLTNQMWSKVIAVWRSWNFRESILKSWEFLQYCLS